jgi:hypothetical protein
LEGLGSEGTGLTRLTPSGTGFFGELSIGAELTRVRAVGAVSTRVTVSTREVRLIGGERVVGGITGSGVSPKVVLSTGLVDTWSKNGVVVIFGTGRAVDTLDGSNSGILVIRARQALGHAKGVSISVEATLGTKLSSGFTEVAEGAKRARVISPFSSLNSNLVDQSHVQVSRVRVILEVDPLEGEKSRAQVVSNKPPIQNLRGHNQGRFIVD